MASFSEIASDLKAITAFVEKQVAAGQKKDTLLERQSAAIRTNLALLKTVALPEATELTSFVDSGPWTKSQKSELLNSIQSLVDGQGRLSIRKAFQKCLSYEQCLTQKEWDGLLSTALVTAKINQLAQRANSLGITTPAEPTVYRIMLVLCWALQRMPGATAVTPEDAKLHYHELKVTIKRYAAQCPYPHQHLIEYPVKPQDLPEEMFRYAYPDDEPVQKHIPELTGVIGFKMRGRKSGPAGGLEFLSMLQKAYEQHSQKVHKSSPMSLARSSNEMSFQLSPSKPQLALCDQPAAVQRNLGQSSLAFKSRSDPPVSGKDGPDDLDGEPLDENENGGEQSQQASAEMAVCEMERELSSMRAGKKRDAIMKRPGMHKLASGVIKKPATAVSPLSAGAPQMPKMNAEMIHPVSYKGARIYTDRNNQAFRCLLRPPDKYSEVRRSFRATDPKDAWCALMAIIEANNS